MLDKMNEVIVCVHSACSHEFCRKRDVQSYSVYFVNEINATAITETMIKTRLIPYKRQPKENPDSNDIKVSQHVNMDYQSLTGIC